jgi:ribosomal protein L11 methylase PrmA
LYFVKVVVFRKQRKGQTSFEVRKVTIFDEELFMFGYDECLKIYKNTTGGTHPTPFKAVKEIISRANIKDGDCCVDVGTGVNTLATVLSLASNNKVIAFDLGKCIRLNDCYYNISCCF